MPPTSAPFRQPFASAEEGATIGATASASAAAKIADFVSGFPLYGILFNPFAAEEFHFAIHCGDPGSSPGQAMRRARILYSDAGNFAAPIAIRPQGAYKEGSP
ncbi:MAG TPA: hypothetical protein VJY34_20040 [Roseiarcus sp.]|nr:hypothetical protein [Roseiarcus sp.]